MFAVMDADATTIGIEPADQTVVVGDTVTVDIVIDTEFLIGAFDLNLNFDSSILSFVNLLFGGFVGNGDELDFVNGSVRNAPFADNGVVNFAEFFNEVFDSTGLSQLQGNGEFVLASITFDAIGLGLSSLSLSDLTLGEFDIFADPLTASLFGASIRVTERPVSVPEPSTWLLMLTGLGLILARRTRTVH